MNINELMKSLSGMNGDLKTLIKKSEIDKYEDLSGLEADNDNPDDNLLMYELRNVMLHLSDISSTISYLQKPVKGEYVLHKNSGGRYECSAHEFTCGNIIEYYANDEYEGHYRWVVSRVEHNGDDYYIVGSHTLSYDREYIPLEGLRIRIR